MSKSFSAQVQRINNVTLAKLTAVTRASIQDVINDAQTVGPSKASVNAAIKKGLGGKGRGKKRKLVQGPVTAPGKGGRMRVDTGFLRASGQASLNGMPQGPVRGDPNKKYDYNNSTVMVALSGLKIGATFFFSWTANYAQYRETYDGFLEGAVMKWQSFVDKNVRRLNGEG